MTSNAILVTGFKPFGNYDKNASWEAVSRLQQKNFSGHQLVQREIPVVYRYVDENIPSMWAELNPKFVLHVGVCSHARMLTIESRARRKEYVREDAEGNLHPTREALPSHEGADVYHSQVDIDAIINDLQGHKVQIGKSLDAGLFICEYTFYLSLHVDPSRCLFIHVPPVNEPYSPEEVADALTAITKSVLKRSTSEHRPEQQKATGANRSRQCNT